MSYVSNEAAHLAPLELYTFTFGPTTYRYTSGDETATDADGNSYTPNILARRRLEASSEDTSQSIEIEVAHTDPVAAWFRSRFQAHRVSVTVKRRHRDVAGEAVIFSGVGESGEFTPERAILTVAPIRRAVRRQLPTMLAQRLCNWQFGGTECGVVLATYTASGTGVSLDQTTGILTMSGTVTTTYAVPDLTGGVVAWTGTDGETWRSTIAEHLTTTTVRLLTPPTAWTGGTAITVTRGCDHTHATCSGVFSNIANFGGFPVMPGRDPFKGAGWP